MKKTLHYARTDAYDMLISVDDEKACRYLTETKDFPTSDDQIESFLGSVEDDTSWADDCSYDDIFVDGVDLLYTRQVEL